MPLPSLLVYPSLEFNSWHSSWRMSGLSADLALAYLFADQDVSRGAARCMEAALARLSLLSAPFKRLDPWMSRFGCNVQAVGIDGCPDLRSYNSHEIGAAPLEIARTPEWDVIKEFPRDCSDQPLYEQVRPAHSRA